MQQQDIALVPGHEHYNTRYVASGRLFSFAHQMNAILEHDVRSVLEIGPGPGMVTAALRAIGIQVTTVDVQPELKPDVVASVTELPFDDLAFDACMCCQVLEHLPLDQLVPSLKELRRVSRKVVVVSLPDCTVGYRLHANLPKLRDLRFNWSRTRRSSPADRERKLERDGHYWEIGYPNIDSDFIATRMAEADLHLARSWRVPEMPYHHFFASTPS